MKNDLVDLLRIVADEVDQAAISEAEADRLEMVVWHIRDCLKGGITDRARQTKLMLRMLQR